MTQYSWPFAAESPAAYDARPQTDAETREWWRELFLSIDPTVQFLVPARNELAVTAPGANQIAVATGIAIVDGTAYLSDGVEILAVDNAPGGQSRVDRVILRSTFGAGDRRCRLYILEGTPGTGVPPTLTQTRNTQWEMSLARYTVSDAGAISGLTSEVTEESYIGVAAVIRLANMGLESVDTAALVDRAVTNGKLRMSLGTSVVGRAANSTGGVADIRATVNGGVLRRQSDALSFGVVPVGAYGSNTIPNTAFQHRTGPSVLGRAAGTSGAVGDIAATTENRVLARAGGSLAFRQITEPMLGDDIDASARGFNAQYLQGYTPGDLLAGGVIRGAIILWYGSLGGSDGHRPVIGTTPNEDWHLCNGQTVSGQATPDLRDKFVVGAGSSYAKGATGGSTTSSHTHGVGTYNITAGGAHTHPVPNTGIPVEATLSVSAGAGYTVPQGWHSHTVADTSERGTHAHYVAGASAAAAPSNLPPYRAAYYICKVA